ncbi:hypothetical protein J6P92_05525 [bacterium]|nr:hypothetical protein [bacterium]
MKKVVFYENNISPLICGLFMLFSSVALTFYVFLKPIKTDGLFLFCIILFAICGFLLVLFIFLQKKSGLHSININDYEIIFRQYNTNQQLEDDSIMLNNIASFKTTFKNIIDYGKTGNQTPCIETTMIIKCHDETEHKFFTIINDNKKIKQLFKLAKNIPNFIYNVETNSHEWNENLRHIANKGRDLPIHQYVSLLFHNPNIPEEHKFVFRAEIIYMGILLLIVLIMIISIITDLIK